MLEPDLVEPDLQLLRHQHGLGGVDALPHLGRRDHQRHQPLAVNADEGIGGEAGRFGRRSGAKRGWQHDGEGQAAADRGADLEEPAAVEAGSHRTIRHDLSLPHAAALWIARSEEHTSELQSLMRNSYAFFFLKKKKLRHNTIYRI